MIIMIKNNDNDDKTYDIFKCKMPLHAYGLVDTDISGRESMVSEIISPEEAVHNYFTG